MMGRGVTEGALLLAGMRARQGDSRAAIQDPLRADDLLPIEMLTARLQATRSQTMMFEKLIDSEKFAGLGQLAANVTHQLNNPLTVILGYASLLEETVPLDARERKGVESILTEARRMRSTLESLSRISRTQSDQLAAVSVAEMLADMEQLHRLGFSGALDRVPLERRSVPAQGAVQCAATAAGCAALPAVFHYGSGEPGAGFGAGGAEDDSAGGNQRGQAGADPGGSLGSGIPESGARLRPLCARAGSGETAGLGLSLCATILRDHNGRASAVNLEPRGAAIILELRAA